MVTVPQIVAKLESVRNNGVTLQRLHCNTNGIVQLFSAI